MYGDVTLCNECWRVIQPIWVLSADEKKKLQEEGRTFREIVFLKLNAEGTALQSQTFEEGGSKAAALTRAGSGGAELGSDWRIGWR